MMDTFYEILESIVQNWEKLESLLLFYYAFYSFPFYFEELFSKQNW